MKNYKKIISAVDEIYKWIDQQQSKSKHSTGCDACGKCCDFKSFGHRLYITTPEMMFFVDKIGIKNIKLMSTNRCPYQVEGPLTSPEMVSLSNHKCTVYPYRFAGCRIFSCKANAGFQSELTESAIKKFKALCETYQIPYQYVDLPTA